MLSNVSYEIMGSSSKILEPRNVNLCVCGELYEVHVLFSETVSNAGHRQEGKHVKGLKQ